MGAEAATTKDYFRILTIIYLAMLGGLVVLLILAVYVMSESQPQHPALAPPLLILAPVAVLAGMLGSLWGYRRLINLAARQELFGDKLTGYQTACVVRLAALEFPGLLCAFGYMVTGDIVFLALTGLMILLILLSRPTRDRLISDLELQGPELQLIEDPDAVVPGLLRNQEY